VATKVERLWPSGLRDYGHHAPGLKDCDHQGGNTMVTRVERRWPPGVERRWPPGLRDNARRCGEIVTTEVEKLWPSGLRDCVHQ
jgi:hypothetical protein